LVMFGVAVVIASIFSPSVDFFASRKVPRALGAALMYLLTFGVLALVVYLIIPPVAAQLKGIATNLPLYLDKWSDILKTFGQNVGFENTGSIQELLKSQGEKLAQASTGAAQTLFGILGGFFQAFVVVILSFYMLIEKAALEHFLQTILTPAQERKVLNILSHVQTSVSAWIRGQLLLSLIVGVAVFIGLTLLKVDYALTLALVAAVLEIIPVVGPIVSTILGVSIAFGQSTLAAVLVLALYVGIQQVENHILVPKIMGKAVGLSPVVIILALLVGAKLLGFLGIILAIPLAATIAAIVRDLREKSV